MRCKTGKSKGALKEILTREFLYDEHIIKQKCVQQIAREINCDRTSVSNYLNLFKIEYWKQSNGCKTKTHKMWQGYEDISMTYWKNVIHGAKTRNIPFELTIESAWDLFIKQNRRCALSGREIGFECAKRNSASLDRVDSTKGYILDNIQWLHRDVNFAKQSLTTGEFINLCQEVVNYKTQ
jgi:hypothetical protein